MTKRNIYINSQGGLGFNLALAHIAKELKESYGKICICSPYFDVFESCPYVDYVYKPMEIRDFIFDAKRDDAKLICERMYDTEDFIYKKLSYADAWRKAAGLPVKGNTQGSDTKSELNPSKKYPNINKEVSTIMTTINDKGFKKFIIVQFEGGQSPLDPPPIDANGQPNWSMKPTSYNDEPLKRHYPCEKADEFIRLFHEQHPDIGIINYALPNEHEYEYSFKFTTPYLTYYELANRPECVGIVAIDSSLQHMVAGITKAVVIWGHSLPLSFGYEYNKNILQTCNRDDILYFSALGPSGARIDYISPEELLAETNKYLFDTKVLE